MSFLFLFRSLALSSLISHSMLEIYCDKICCSKRALGKKFWKFSVENSKKETLSSFPLPQTSSSSFLSQCSAAQLKIIEREDTHLLIDFKLSFSFSTQSLLRLWEHEEKKKSEMLPLGGDVKSHHGAWIRSKSYTKHNTAAQIGKLFSHTREREKKFFNHFVQTFTLHSSSHNLQYPKTFSSLLSHQSTKLCCFQRKLSSLKPINLGWKLSIITLSSEKSWGEQVESNLVRWSDSS